MDFTNVQEFYPNACIVCSETPALNRCFVCQMVSYCGTDHLKEHLPQHKNLCKIISIVARELEVSHLFEKLRGVDMLTWRNERMKLSYEVEMRYRRNFEMNDRFMFKFPRACFVCHESRQDLLTNCPGCPATSFCQEHPSSPIHDEDCAKLKECFEHAISLDTYDGTRDQRAIISVLCATKPPKFLNQPASLREFLFEYANPRYPIITFTDNLRIHISEIFTISLTTFSALQKLNYPSVSELTIHAGHVELPVQFSRHWETLLHLLPNLKVLKVLVWDYHYDIPNYVKEIPICSTCRSKGRKLTVDIRAFPYAVYMNQKNYKQPNILIYSNLPVPEKDDCDIKASIDLLEAWLILKCPLIITSFTENDNRLIKQTMKSILGKTDFCFNGYNPFKSLLWFRTYEDGRVGSSNHHMIILKPQMLHTKKPSNNDMPCKMSDKLIRNFFYASVCHVCQSVHTSVTCNRCKMIFYCGKIHRSKNQSQHKDLCQVILKMLNESGTSNLFEKLKTTDSELWLRAKIDLMMKAQLKLERKLLDYEKQMFLYPKTCFVCHESDLNVLKNCSCGVSLCKIHKADPSHQELCTDLSLAFKLTINGRPKVWKATVQAVENEEDKNLSSIEVFIDSVLQLKKETSEFQDFYIQKIMISDFLTMPLTVLWSLQTLGYKIDSSMIVHVIGAPNSEIFALEYWKIILYFLHSLKTLTLVFVGLNIADRIPRDLETQLEFSKSSLADKTFKIENYPLQYEEYFKSDAFIQPNVIVGFNLHIHESELGITDCFWKDTILTLSKVEAPFILTSGSKERAQKDITTLCEYLDTSIEYICWERNPFAGLIPLRDFESEKLMYSNQFVIVYNKLVEIEEFSEFLSQENPTSVENSDSERMLAQIMESIRDLPIDKNLNYSEKPQLIEKQQSVLSKNIYDLVEENLWLKKENEELLHEILRLKEENERLREEKLIEDIEEFE